MPVDPHERALAVFDAYLRYVREVAGAASAPRGVPAWSAPSPVAVDSSEDRTNPAIQLPPPTAARPAGGAIRRDTEEVRVDPSLFDHDLQNDLVPEPDPAPAPSSAAKPAVDAVSVWDERTRERPRVVEELRQAEREIHAQGQPPRAAPPRVGPPEQSIIVDDAIAGPPDVPTQREPPTFGTSQPVSAFLTEMTVLVKYGHASQVERELEYWLRAHPDELEAHLLVAEFTIAKIEISHGLERLFALASRALDHGDHGLASRVLQRVSREAPADLRVMALRDRLGLPH